MEQARPASGDTVTLLAGGREAFPRMLSAIRGAKQSVHLEIYYLAREGVGTPSGKPSPWRRSGEFASG